MHRETCKLCNDLKGVHPTTTCERTQRGCSSHFLLPGITAPKPPPAPLSIDSAAARRRPTQQPREPGTYSVRDSYRTADGFQFSATTSRAILFHRIGRGGHKRGLRWFRGRSPL